MALAEEFEAHRDRLRAVAYRMLGSHADAEDAVQEAWLRLSRQDAGEIENLGGWLTTVVGRISLDVLRSGRRRPEVSYEEGPEYAVTPDGTPAPEELAAIGDSVGVALLTVLDTLRPDERLAFVLHDVFAVPFAEVGPILGKSADATKMLASRARRKVQGAQQPARPGRREREVVQAFLAAAREGRFERLLDVLHPEVKLTAHTSNGTYVVLGATEVATRARLAAAAAHGHPTTYNGLPAILARTPEGTPQSLLTFTVTGDRITEITVLADPARLARTDLPEGA
ncbi:sigma-70 family RNA polymerase sigma factor [Streptomyces drozdowiczii]|uniref:Sigma-70 family RNA polymerase sigma factor n=1 Tax=Streptomyces drozdowiczii TaxID=202862 RepID=A0ABY6PRU1_9ACTN|nr:sigma-70 family RNA polymerase sigma factor [Streptomyces drozdowiczii]MCX0245414.1 sigma-70 family RNA polymerase sigma factor [Streptomyces drozdowiczii]UZK54943.1 sigma-70 family RNA polymerase sigma factor [Streptomyces drozdowiczii]